MTIEDLAGIYVLVPVGFKRYDLPGNLGRILEEEASPTLFKVRVWEDNTYLFSADGNENREVKMRLYPLERGGYFMAQVWGKNDEGEWGEGLYELSLIRLNTDSIFLLHYIPQKPKKADSLEFQCGYDFILKAS